VTAAALIACVSAPVSAPAQQAPQKRASAPAAAVGSVSSLCSVKPRDHDVGDARTAAAKARLTDGVHVVARTRTGLQLVAVVRGGKILDYAVSDRAGNGLEAQTIKAPSTAGDDCNPCCWKCGKDAGGTVHCWQIDCPIMVPNTEGEG
jgi:hypothetical protein